MTRRILTAIAATAVAAALAFGAPAATQASIYPPSGSCTASPTTVAPGGTTTVRCAAETFSANEDVTITVTGENGAGAVIGMVRFAISTASGHVTSTADGSIAGVSVTFPSNASGTYNIAAVSSTSAGGNAAVTVANADGSLPTTGLDSATLTGLWIGGGLLLLAGGALAVVAIMRRRRDQV